MKILIADTLPEAPLDTLRQGGHELTVQPSLGADQIPEVVADHEALVVRSTKVTKATLDAASALQLIVRAGAGTNTIDVEQASRRGVFVANCPGKNAIAVAELTIGMMLSLDRRIHLADKSLREGKWLKKQYGKADGLYGKTLGLVGFGNIAREVCIRAQAMGLKVQAWSRSLQPDDSAPWDTRCCENLEELVSSSDIVSVHVPYNEDTKDLIGKQLLANAKLSAMLINTSRAGIVNEVAVAQAMTESGLRYATDVFDDEPGSGEDSFTPKFAPSEASLLTPHIGASTEQAQHAVADEAIRIIMSFAATGVVPNCVNLCEKSPAKWQLNVRHVDRVGVLASVLSSIREQEINVEEVENIIFDGAIARCARIRLSAQPTEKLVTQIESIDDVIDARVLQLRA